MPDSESPLPSGFMVVHGNQPELLRQLLVHWFQAHPLAPLEDETVLVQSNGIAQWLKLALAGEGDAGAGCGIAAAFDMLLPSRFVWRAYRAVLGADAVPERSAFDKALLVWRLLRLLPELTRQAGYEPLQQFLAGDADLRKRHQLAEKIADLFDQYQVYRADWLDAWARGEDVLIDSRNEARPLEPGQVWQPLLWRALLVDVGESGGGDGSNGRAAVHRRFLEAAAGLQTRPAGLPRRISVFGLSSLPRQSLEVLLAISRFSQVILCVHNPCEYFWSDLLAEKDHARRSARHRRKAGLPEALATEDLHLHVHPLLAAWGRQGRDYLALLDVLDQPESYRRQFERIGERIDVFESHGETTLLNQLQDDIRLLRSVAESRARWPAVDPAADRSLRFHVAHSMQREVEILHDQLLAAFAADPTLRPRDVIVMVPDVDAFAPHIEAVFGQIEAGDARYLPFSIADQAQRRRASLAFALEFLLGLPESRVAVSDLLDLLDVPAVRQRFGLAAGDLPLLHRWIRQSNIRWGLNAERRAQFMPGLAAHEQAQNTWQHGLERMLLGYAVGGEGSAGGFSAAAWRDIEPYGEVSGLSAALVGPLACLLRRLEALALELAAPALPAVWVERLQALLGDFFHAESAEDALLLLQLQTSLGDWVDACAAAGLNEEIPLAVVREHWLAQLDQASLSRPFMAGRLTFATLMPMRAIPYRMVCLLGMNDGEFPRARPPLDFDLMARDMRPGDRSRREDDRYLFLEALLSARERLHISWVGRSIHDNSPRPPSVLVSQLRDHLVACWRLAGNGDDADALLAALTVEHRLQPFSSDYFGGEPPTAALFTYAREWERGERGERAPPGGMQAADAPLPPPGFDAAITLRQLAAFLKDPVRSFYRERLDIRYETDTPDSEDYEPFSVDGLAQWSLQDRLIQARLEAVEAGRDEAQAVARQLARIRRCGELPIGSMAALTAEALTEPLDRMFELRARALADWPLPLADQPFAYQQTHAGGTLLVEGSITHCYGNAAGQPCRIELNSSNLLDDEKYRRDKLLAAWVLHLAAHLAEPFLPMTSLIIGKNGLVQLQPLAPELAREYFSALVDAYVGGLCEPLPLAAKTGFAWLEKQGRPCHGPLEDCAQAAVGAARSRYEGGYNSHGEVGQSAYLQQCYPNFALLWSNGRFSQLCADLYAPLMRHVGAAPQTT
ncbi:DNA helicase/exodeoxyribonuclease V, gamma subunit [Sterolibacterium denitrificans]|uniref:RecBCD enzyme subunit RecC n=1 Tax=Sterolibacterium denitrificans TaxID=157592 RepID=A0A7Z7HQ78_9PROT|nr:exodeoxyribonuclease V subunit gamma [Sterolibacterium denitrificans]SMB24437.1 DNA helicase/exodeoxyribonuclease V, gamma subunit [Sterolibacterium denitrificans]